MCPTVYNVLIESDSVQYLANEIVRVAFNFQIDSLR